MPPFTHGLSSPTRYTSFIPVFSAVASTSIERPPDCQRTVDGLSPSSMIFGAFIWGTRFCSSATDRATSFAVTLSLPFFSTARSSPLMT